MLRLAAIALLSVAACTPDPPPPPVAVVPTRGAAGGADVRVMLAPAACSVVVALTSLDDVPARFAWQRPSAEIARSTGGPMVACPASPMPSEGTVVARRTHCP